MIGGEWEMPDGKTSTFLCKQKILMQGGECRHSGYLDILNCKMEEYLELELVLSNSYYLLVSFASYCMSNYSERNYNSLHSIIKMT